MSGSIVRSVSFPADDLADVQDLAEEHGGMSRLFQYLYRALLDYRAELGVDPSKAEIAALVHEKKAAEEGRAEVLARMRREKAEERAMRARERAEVVQKAKAPLVQAKPKQAPVREEEPKPLVTFEEHVQSGVDDLRRHGRDNANALRAIRSAAKIAGHDPDKVVSAIRAALSNQTNLLVLPEPQEVR
jgi:hypothetical protein